MTIYKNTFYKIVEDKKINHYTKQMLKLKITCLPMICLDILDVKKIQDIPTVEVVYDLLYCISNQLLPCNYYYVNCKIFEITIYFSLSAAKNSQSALYK